MGVTIFSRTHTLQSSHGFFFPVLLVFKLWLLYSDFAVIFVRSREAHANCQLLVAVPLAQKHRTKYGHTGWYTDGKLPRVGVPLPFRSDLRARLTILCTVYYVLLTSRADGNGDGCRWVRCVLCRDDDSRIWVAQGTNSLCTCTLPLYA